MRNPLVVQSRIIQTIFIGLFVGGLYFNLKESATSPELYFRSITGFFYFYCISSLMFSLSPAILVFPTERTIFLKEESSKMYSTFTFFLSRNIIELPFLIFIPLIYSLILYWMIGLTSTAGQFFTFYLTSALISLCGNSLGLFMGSLSSNATVVTVLTPMFILPFVLFGGLLKNRASLPVWLGWFEYLSPIKYGFIGFLRNQLTSQADLNMLNRLNFDLGLWEALFILLGISIGIRLFSLLFLYLGRRKLQ